MTGETPTTRDEQQLAALVEIEERLASQGLRVPPEVREQIAYYESRLKQIRGEA